MSAKAFVLMFLAVVLLGGVAGGALFAFNGGNSAESAIAAATATPTSDLVNDATASGDGTTGILIPGSSTQTDGERAQGGRQGLNIEPIAGIIDTIGQRGLTITSAETGAQTEIIVPPQTPVRLSEIAGDTDALALGTEVVAFLQRATDGTISVTNITIGGFSGGRGDGGGLGMFGGRAGALGGGTTTSGTEFNAVPGTITNFVDGIITLEAVDGLIDVTIADDTPIQRTIAFTQATDRIATNSQVTVIGQRDEAGAYIPITIVIGDLGGFGGGRGTFGGGGRRDQQGTGDGDFGEFQTDDVIIVP